VLNISHNTRRQKYFKKHFEAFRSFSGSSINTGVQLQLISKVTKAFTVLTKAFTVLQQINCSWDLYLVQKNPYIILCM